MFFWRKNRKRARGSSPNRILARQIMLGLLSMLGVGLLVLGVWYGTRIDMLTITAIVATGGETVKASEVERIAREELAGAYALLIPRSFAWTYPKEEIESALKENGRIRTAEIERVSGTELAIRIDEYRPAALWCESVDDRTCLFIDSEGYAFEEAPSLSGTAFVRYSDVARAPEAGAHAYDAATGARFARATAMLEDQYGWSVFHIEQTAPEEIVYHLARGGAIKVSLRADVDSTLRNLATVLAAPEFSDLAPGNFAYIDLRYGDKVFVNEEALAAQNETAASSTDAAE